MPIKKFSSVHDAPIKDKAADQLATQPDKATAEVTPAPKS